MSRPALLATGIGAGLILTLGAVAVSQQSPQAPAAAPGLVVPPAPRTAGPRAQSVGGGGSGNRTAPTVTSAGPVVVNGTAASTQYGTVQIQITLSHHRIVAVHALTLPSGGRSSRISAYAAPALRQETLAAQSAAIDTVSGASYTSEGWRSSLQGALDIARARGY